MSDIWFGWPVNGNVVHIINTTSGTNSTANWDALQVREEEMDTRTRWHSLVLPRGPELLRIDALNCWKWQQASMAKVQHSTRLLAWYVCDDCDNAVPYPLDGLQRVYTELKRLDPFHLVMGAPW